MASVALASPALARPRPRPACWSVAPCTRKKFCTNSVARGCCMNDPPRYLLSPHYVRVTSQLTSVPTLVFFRSSTDWPPDLKEWCSPSNHSLRPSVVCKTIWPLTNFQMYIPSPWLCRTVVALRPFISTRRTKERALCSPEETAPPAASR